MSTTPARPTSPPPQATTRRVSFSPAVNDILTAVNARRRSRSNSSSAAPSHSNHRLALGANGSATPCTTPHRTRNAARDAETTPSSTTTNSSPRKLTGKASAAVLLPPAGSSSPPPPLPAAALSPSARDSVSGTTTTTIEFSIKDISLDGQMAPPVWRESSTPLRRPSSRHATPSHRTPPSSHMSAHPSAEERRGDPLADSSPSAKPSNPYADVARDQSNLRRRQRVVRTLFDSHEDAVRLYIRLQQLLGYRDVCRAEFEQRLRFTHSEAEREAVVAARAQRLAAQEKEIERMQAVLATVDDVVSSEFASSMNSLYSTQSGTPSDRVAHRDGIVSPHIRPQTGSQHHNDNNSSERRAPRRGSDTPTTAVAASSKRNPAAATTTAKKNQLTSTDTRRASAEPQRPASTPRHGTPREALEAWRTLHTGKAASAIDAKRECECEGEREEKKNEGEHKYPDPSRGAMPRNSVTASTNSMPHLNGRARSGGVASVLRVTQEEAPPAPRQAAPFGSASSSEAPYRSGMPSADQSSTYASSTRESSSVRSRPGGDGRPWLRSAEAAAAAKSPASLSPLPQQEQQQEATPEQEKKALARSVAGLVTPPRAGQSSGFASYNRSPNYRQNTSRALLAAQDSPLARFRQQHGYQDPQQHYLVQPSAHTAATATTTTAPLRESPSLLGSPKRVPRQWQTPPTVEAGEPRKADNNGARETVVSQPKQENAEESASTPPSKVKREPHAGPGTALLRAGLNGGDGKGPLKESSSNCSSVAPSDSAKEAAVVSMKGSSPLAGPTRPATSQRYDPADSKGDPSATKGSPSAAESSEAVSKVPLSVIDRHSSGLVSSPSPSLLCSPPQRGSPLRQLNAPPTPQTAADVAAIPSATGSSSARDSFSPDATHKKRSDSEAERPQSSQLTGTDAADKGVREPVNPPHDHSSRESDSAVWDGIAELERRVGGLESRTAEMEKNAAKRAVLDAIRLLRERVAVLESRAAVLEGCQDESQLHQLQWRPK